MEMNKYLNDSDSDFNDFESVSSELLSEYEKKYVQLMNLGQKKKEQKNQQKIKDEKLKRLLRNSS